MGREMRHQTVFHRQSTKFIGAVSPEPDESGLIQKRLKPWCALGFVYRAACEFLVFFTLYSRLGKIDR